MLFRERVHRLTVYTLFEDTSQRIERGDNLWTVHYQLLDSGRAAFDAPTMFVTADIVILAAGALGSTEVLLRSCMDRTHGGRVFGDMVLLSSEYVSLIVQ